VFLSTDSGSTGLNLQNASVVVNCDLPWNPARLEQRIARAWRKHQTKPVTVIHLVSQNTIEQRMLETLSIKQALADGILDLRGDLNAIRFRGGKQAFIARLEQLISPTPKAAVPAPKKKVLPVDRALGFSQIARKIVGPACLRCEERYPAEGPHSVIVIVVDRDAPLCQEKLLAPFEEFFGREVSDPLAPVTLEVIDRSADEAMTRLVAAGLISLNTRAVRELDASSGAAGSEPTEAERQIAQEHRRQANRKLKMAALLGGGGLLEEEREALLQAGLWLGKALGVENRVAEPGSLEDALRPPHALFWGSSLPIVRAYATDPSSAAAPAAAALRALAGQP
jgi:hypothetical protein